MPRSRSPIRRSPDLHGGQPVFANSTVPLKALLDHLRGGGDVETFLAVHPDLQPAQVTDVLAYALDQLIERERIPLGPPQTSLLPRTDDGGAVTNAAELSAHLVVGRRVLCPACRALVFQSWPEGWDSHAEHRCSGLTATDPARRKAEFKRRYEYLFR